MEPTGGRLKARPNNVKGLEAGVAVTQEDTAGPKAGPECPALRAGLLPVRAVAPY